MARRALRRGGFRAVWAGILVIFAAAGAAAPAMGGGGGGAVAEHTAAIIARAAARAAFGPAEVVATEPYYDAEDAVSAYSVELRLAATGAPCVVIVSGRRDDVPVLMLWRGLPRHLDPAVLERAREALRVERGEAVSAPDAVIWLDLFEAWGVYPEIDPETARPFLVNLFDGRSADMETLADKWAERQRRFAAIHGAGAGRSLKAAGLAGHIAAKWAEADEIVALEAAAEGSFLKQAPVPSTRYIEGVPNLNQGGTPDCGIVAAMDIVLYWDTRGYDRLVDGGDLAAVRTDLRNAMGYSGSGTTDPGTRSGLESFVNAAAYGNQYSFAVVLLDEPNPSFADLTAEIDNSRPVMFGVEKYTDDPANPYDDGYGDHWMCAVGYYDGKLLPQHASTRWVIVHDNWGGGTYSDPYLIDNEPYIDWNRATDCIIQVRPQPAGTAVTYPSASGIRWTTGQPQLITWRGFDAATVTIELLKGGAAVRTIAAAAANSPRGGSWTFTPPSDLDNGEDYRIRVSAAGQSDVSDNLFSIFASTYLQITSPSAAGITWNAGGSYAISWTSVGAVGAVGASVRIELFKGAVLNTVIADSTANDGVHTWTVPVGQTPGSDYRIKITATANAALSDFSDNYFSIAEAPGFRITYPSAAGITWRAGGSYTVTWSTTGNPGAYVALLLYRGETPLLHLTMQTLNTGAYTWTVPATLAAGGDYRIRVHSTLSSLIEDFSDNPFTIEAGAPAALTVTYPSAAGVTWSAGGSVTIAWSSVGAVGSTVRIELFRGSAFSATVAAAAPNTGLFAWSVPAGQAAGSDYRIKITSSADNALFDYSDNPFAIVVPPASAFTLLYPSAEGIRWSAGGSVTITWNPGTGLGAFVRIDLLRSGSLFLNLAFMTENDGAYGWLIPTTIATGSDYRIRISLVGSAGVEDSSDHPFAIRLAGAESLEPNEGTIGTESLLAGSGFGASGKITLGGVKCTPLSWGDASLRFLVKKPLSAGVYDLVVSPKGLPAKTLPACFTIRPPQLDPLGTTQGRPGELVTVSGRFFGSKKGKVALVDYAGNMVPCKVAGWSMSAATNRGEVTFALPKKAAGSYLVRLTTGAGTGDSATRLLVY